MTMTAQCPNAKHHAFGNHGRDPCSHCGISPHEYARRRRVEVEQREEHAHTLQKKTAIEYELMSAIVLAAEAIRPLKRISDIERSRLHVTLWSALDELEMWRRTNHPAGLVEGARVRSRSLPHHEGVIKVIKHTTNVVVRWDNGALKEHLPTALEPIAASGKSR